MGPSGLHHVHILARADTFKLGDFSLDEWPGFVSGGLRVEVRVQVGCNNINHAAECAAARQPRLDWLSGADGASIASAGEGALGGRNETSKSRSTAVAIEDSLVTNDNELNNVPLGPFHDVGDLALCTGDTGAADEDAEDQLHVVGTGSRANILEGAAVGAVDTDGAEAFACDSGDVR